MTSPAGSNHLAPRQLPQPPFRFYTERRLVELTGRRARNLGELLEHLQEVPGSSIFYHTHHQYLSHHFETPVFHNDFAGWVLRALRLEQLAERLAAIDLLAFTSIRQLRRSIVSAIQDYLAEGGWQPQESPPGDEFHFCLSRSFVMPTGIVAGDEREFFAKLPGVTNVSLFFHFFLARLRLERPTNDFSQWLGDLGHRELAKAIDRLDPYSRTLDELKADILALGDAYLGSGDGR